MSTILFLLSGVGDAFVWGTSLDDEIRSGVGFQSRILGLGRSYSTSTDGHILIWDYEGNLVGAYATGIAGTDEFYGAWGEGDSLTAIGFLNDMGNSDALLMKTDPELNNPAFLAIRGPRAEYLMAASGPYLVGYTDSWGSGQNDVLLLRFEGNSLIWALALGGQGFDCGEDVVVVGDDAVVVGYTESYGFSGQAFVMRVGPDGSLRWFRTFGGSGYDMALRVCVNRDTIIVAGKDGSQGGGVLLFALDALGTLLWARLMRATGYEYPMDIGIDNTGIYISGRHTNGGPGFLLKTLPDGSLAWSKYVGGNASDGLGSLILGSGQTIALGYTSSFGFGRRDFLFVSVDPTGYNCVARDAGFTSVPITLPDEARSPNITSAEPQLSALENSVFPPTLSYQVWCEGAGVEESPSAVPGKPGIYDCAGRRLASPPGKSGVYFILGQDGKPRMLLK